MVLGVRKQEVVAKGKAHHLTPTECRLLEVLMNHADHTVPPEDLMKEVWDTDYLDDTRTLMCMSPRCTRRSTRTREIPKGQSV